MAGSANPTEHPSHDPGPSNPEATPTPPPQPNEPPPPPPNQPRSPSQPRDYIIQVPRDQVFHAHPPDNQRPLERNASRKRPSRCCCCLCTTLVLLVVALAAAAGVLYLIFRPKAPSYSVQSLAIGGLNVSSPTFKTDPISPEINVTIIANNPNKRIGFYYRDGSSIDVYYSGSVEQRLCSGRWPAFYHGNRNETVVRVALIEEELRLRVDVEDEMKKRAGNMSVPLKVDVDVQLNIKFGAVKLWKMTMKVRCDVVVNELSPVAKVVSTDCGHEVDVV